MTDLAPLLETLQHENADLRRRIAELEQTEATLRQSEERLREVLENSRDVAYRRDFRDTAKDYMSPAFVRISGYTPEEMAALPVADLLELTHPADRANIHQMMVESRQDLTRVSHQLEFRFKHKDGQYRWFQDRFSTELDTQGQPIARIGSVRDISQRKQAEDALHASEKKFRLLFENMAEGFSLHEIITDEQGRAIDFRFLDANAAYERHTGHKPQDIIGRTLLEIMPQADRRQIEDYGRVALTGEPLAYEYYSKTFNRHLRVRSFCPQPGRFATIFEDITDRKQAEEALHESEANLSAVFNATDESIFLIAPDLTLLALNAVAAQRMGRPPEDLLGRKVYDLLPSEVAARRRPFIERALLSGEPVAFEDQRNDRWTANHIYPVLNAAGQVTRLAIYSRDITRRKQTEDALRESEEKFRAIVEQSTEGIALIDEQGTIIEWNHAQEQITGIPRAEALGQPAWEIQLRQTTSARRAHVTLNFLQHSLLQMLATGQSPQFHRPIEIPLETASGETRIVIQNAFPIKTDRGHRLGVIVHDITERKQMEEALRVSEQRWSFALEGAGDGVWDLDFTAQRAFYSPQWKAMLGYANDDISDSFAEWTDRLHPDDRPAVMVEVQRHVDGLTPIYQSEFRMRAKDGTYRWILGRGKVVSRAPDGQPRRVIGTHTNITARKQAAALLERRAAQAAVVNEIGQQITAALAVDDVLARAARLIHERLGLQHVGIFVFNPDRTELVLRGRAGDFTQLFAADHRLPVGQGIVGWVAQHGRRLLVNDVQAEALYVNMYGEAVPTRSELAVPILSAGVVQGVLDVQSVQINAFNQDDVLTKETLAAQIAVALENARLYEQIQRHSQQLEQRVTERTVELQAANVRLTELDRLKDEFLSRISHELRTPLAGILIALDLLETAQPEKRERYLLRLKEAAYRMRDLIEDVLAFTQLNRSVEPTRPNQFDVNDWLESRLTAWQARCAERNLALQLDLTPDLPRALADADMVLQALTRLLTNAVNYTPAGTVTLATARRDEAGQGWVTVSVTDTGPGIAAEDLPHIFERFYRGRAAADFKKPGTGIGLTISREIAERLGGRLTVETQVGVGSTFTLWLRAA